MLVGFLAVGMRPDVSVTKTHVVLLAGLIYYYIAILGDLLQSVIQGYSVLSESLSRHLVMTP